MVEPYILFSPLERKRAERVQKETTSCPHFLGACGGSCSGACSGGGASRSFDKTCWSDAPTETSPGIMSHINGLESHFVGRASRSTEHVDRRRDGGCEADELGTMLWRAVSRPEARDDEGDEIEEVPVCAKSAQ